MRYVPITVIGNEAELQKGHSMPSTLQYVSCSAVLNIITLVCGTLRNEGACYGRKYSH
jgi:hypothetical protein